VHLIPVLLASKGAADNGMYLSCPSFVSVFRNPYPSMGGWPSSDGLALEEVADGASKNKKDKGKAPAAILTPEVSASFLLLFHEGVVTPC